MSTIEISDEGAMKLYNWLKQSTKTEHALKDVTDCGLAALLCEHVQAYVSMMSPQYDLLDEVIRRLESQ